MFIVVGLVCLVVAAGVFLVASAYASRTGISSASRVLASDTSQGRVELLEDHELRLRGQPDYIMEKRVFPLLGPKRLFPVELKTGTQSSDLRDSDRFQLLVYLLLMKARYGSRASKVGYVRYGSATFPVRLTWWSRRECLRVIERVRRAKQADDVRRNHRVAARCRGCSVRSVCSQSLVS